MAPTSQRTSRPRQAFRTGPGLRAPAPRRSRTSRAPRAVHINVGVTDATLTAGTSRATDLGALVETALGEQWEGALIKRIDVRGVWRPAATGASTCSFGFFRGPSTLDAADLAPATDPGQNWLNWTFIPTYGQRHLVATTPTLEFEEFRRRFTLRSSHRMKSFGDTLWFCEEALSQNWTGNYVARIWYIGS